MKKYIQKILQHQFVRQFLTLFTGTVVSQLIVFGVTPILTRIYTEKLFGILTLYTSITLTLKILITLRYEITLVLPKRDKDAINLLALNILIVTALSVVVLIISILLKNQINNLFDDGGLGQFIYLVAPGVFSLGLIEAFTFWNNRFQKYNHISQSRISRSVSGSAFQLLVGYSKFSNIGLVPGLIVGQFISLIHLITISLKKIKTLTNYISFARMFFLFKKYKDIPKYNTLLNFANTLSNQIPGLLIPNYFGLSSAGQFGLSNRVVATPFSMIGQSVSQIFFKKSADIFNNNRKDFYGFVKKTYKNLFIISLLLSATIFVASFFFELIFGSTWSYSGLYTRILVPWLFLMFLNSPITSIIVVLNKQQIMIAYDILLLIFRIVAIFSGYYFFDSIILALIFYSFTGVCFNLYLIFLFLKISKKASLSTVNNY